MQLPVNLVEHIFNARIEHLFLTYLKLREMCSHGHIKMSDKQIYADTMGVSLSTFNRHIKALEALEYIETYNDDIKHIKSIYEASNSIDKKTNIKVVNFPFNLGEFNHAAIGEFSAVLHEIIIEKIMHNKNVAANKNSIKATVQSLALRVEKIVPVESRIAFHVGCIKKEIAEIKGRLSKLNWMNNAGNFGKSHQDILDNIVNLKKELDGLAKQLSKLEAENEAEIKGKQSSNKVDEDFKVFNDANGLTTIVNLDTPFDADSFDPSNEDRPAVTTVDMVAYSYASKAVNRSVTTIQKYRHALINKGIARRKKLYLGKITVDVENGLDKFSVEENKIYLTYVQPFDKVNSTIPLYVQNEGKVNTRVIMAKKGAFEVYSTERVSSLKVSKKKFITKKKYVERTVTDDDIPY